MHYKPYFLSIVFLLITTISYAQQMEDDNRSNSEKANIEKTIELYFEGWLTGDTTKIGKAMHATCKLKNIKEGRVATYDRTTYLGFFKPRPRLENAGGRILDIDVTGPVASAKVELETTKRLFTDYFNLMKVEDWWFIVDKVSTNIQK